MRKRGANEMETQEAALKLKADKSPELRVQASFDSEMQFVLKPDLFRMLTKIGDLFVTKVVDEEYWIKKMNKAIDNSHYYGKLSLLRTIVDQYIPKVGVLDITGSFSFYDERDPSSVSTYQVDGCFDETTCE